MALQIHESVGHAVELDRILGWEAAFAGTSWLDLSQLGSLRFGSELMNITADATLPGALGSFGYDDEGTPAHPVDIVRHGVWVGALSGRDSAALAGLESGGAVRADGYNRIPMVRMTNVGLLPGPASLDQMIEATDDGIYMDTNRSWSIDDKRLNFQFGCEIGWEIKGGKRGGSEEPDLQRRSAALLGRPRHARQPRPVDVLGDAELQQGPADADRAQRAPVGALPGPGGSGSGCAGERHASPTRPWSPIRSFARREHTADAKVKVTVRSGSKA